jgi:hypothetical protein
MTQPFTMSAEDHFALAQMKATVEKMDRHHIDELKDLALQLSEAWLVQRAASRTLVLQRAEDMTNQALEAMAARRVRKRDLPVLMARLVWQSLRG